MAYEKDGNVYYRVREFDDYGKLSKQDIEELEAGARIEISEEKKTLLTLLFGKRKRTEKFIGTAPLDKADPDGILSARPWRKNTWVTKSIFTAAERI